jgi:hypothetical protein
LSLRPGFGGIVDRRQRVRDYRRDIRLWGVLRRKIGLLRREEGPRGGLVDVVMTGLREMNVNRDGGVVLSVGAISVART